MQKTQPEDLPSSDAAVPKRVLKWLGFSSGWNLCGSVYEAKWHLILWTGASMAQLDEHIPPCSEDKIISKLKPKDWAAAIPVSAVTVPSWNYSGVGVRGTRPPCCRCQMSRRCSCLGGLLVAVPFIIPPSHIPIGAASLPSKAWMHVCRLLKNVWKCKSI